MVAPVGCEEASPSPDHRFTDDLSKNNELKFGSCKMRRDRNIAPDFLAVNARAGMIRPHDNESGATTRFDVAARTQKDADDDDYIKDW